jgi:hypothetical protein
LHGGLKAGLLAQLVAFALTVAEPPAVGLLLGILHGKTYFRFPAGAGQRPEAGPSETGFGVCRRQCPIRFFSQQFRKQIARGIH